jgi:hypothetical protein
VTLLAVPHTLICCRSAARSLTFLSRECEAWYKHISSAYLNLLFVSIDSSSARYSVYRTRERGEPCSVPQATR